MGGEGKTAIPEKRVQRDLSPFGYFRLVNSPAVLKVNMKIKLPPRIWIETGPKLLIFKGKGRPDPPPPQEGAAKIKVKAP